MNIPLPWVKIFCRANVSYFPDYTKKQKHLFIRKSLLVAVDNAITHNIHTVGDNSILQEY
jgi:hypothetical protein